MKAEYDFSRAKRGAVAKAAGKTRITIYLDDDVLAHFRDDATRDGLGYQTVINRTLREAMNPVQTSAGQRSLDTTHLLVEIKQSLDEVKQRLSSQSKASVYEATHTNVDEAFADKHGVEAVHAVAVKEGVETRTSSLPGLFNLIVTPKKRGASSKGARPPLAPEVAGKLLDLFASDDRFRESFKLDPGAALREACAQAPDAEALVAISSMQMNKLASKEDVMGAYDDLRSYLRSIHLTPAQMTAVIIYFEASAPRLRGKKDNDSRPAGQRKHDEGSSLSKQRKR